MSLALIVLAVATLPELGRMIDFQRFETFDPNGPGLGNLFGQVSPFTALGIWPSGDFRLAPGDGAIPALVFYLGAAFASALLIYGLYLCLRRRETVLLAAALSVTAVYVAARAGGTPYTAAKALGVAAPILALVIVGSLVAIGESGRLIGPMGKKGAQNGRGGSRAVAHLSALALYLLAAGACSLLAFANAPVGPTSYSPELTGLRPLVARDPTLVLAPRELIEDEQGGPYIAWELRGGRVCIAAEDEADRTPPPGVRFVVTWESAARPSYGGIELRKRADPYLLWELRRVTPGPTPCPLIAVRQARQGPQP
jgi:hypothetical protein